MHSKILLLSTEVISPWLWRKCGFTQFLPWQTASATYLFSQRSFNLDLSITVAQIVFENCCIHICCLMVMCVSKTTFLQTLGTFWIIYISLFPEEISITRNILSPLVFSDHLHLLAGSLWASASWQLLSY